MNRRQALRAASRHRGAIAAVSVFALILVSALAALDMVVEAWMTGLGVQP